MSLVTKRLHYFTGPEHAVENLKNRQLKVSFPNDVNDVFEMMPYDFGSDQTAQDLRVSWRESIDLHSKKTGFISFSQNWQSPHMWGHYSKNHTGICLAFDVTGDLQRMRYTKKFRRFDYKGFEGLKRKEILSYAFKTKSEHWKYEQEWRLFVRLSQEEQIQKESGQKHFFRHFDKDLILREVIIGAKSSISSSDILNALNGYSPVSTKTARASFRDFKIVEQKLDRLKR